ncbi:MAG: zeta toxin family protein [Cyclobacteriaceae bacterium]
MPELYIITGSNGAGKSTIGSNYLPTHIQHSLTIFDGDKLFLNKRKELYPHEARTHKEARKMANEWVINYFEALVNNAHSKKESFVYEGHFSNESTWEIPKRFKQNGYSINLIFFGLSNPSVSEMRVIERSKTGGHYVSPIEIDLNFYGNLQKLNQHHGLLDNIQIVDTSETKHKVLFQMINNQVASSVPYFKLPNWFIDNLPALAGKIVK